MKSWSGVRAGGQDQAHEQEQEQELGDSEQNVEHRAHGTAYTTHIILEGGAVVTGKSPENRLREPIYRLFRGC